MKSKIQKNKFNIKRGKKTIISFLTDPSTKFSKGIVSYNITYRTSNSLGNFITKGSSL